MDRRQFLVSSAIAAGALTLRSPAYAGDPATAPVAADLKVELKIAADQPLGSIPPSFMGLGYEVSSVAVQGLLSSSNRSYVQLLRTLGAQGVLRIGGNTSDNNASYAPDAPTHSGASGTVLNDAVLHELGGFLDATGWKLLWGLNLGSGSEKQAVAEARAVQSAVGNNLLAFQIGNEPDLFPSHHRKPGYDYEDWLKDFQHYRDALRKGLGKNVPLAGPDAAVKTDWVTRFAADEGKNIALLTRHYYRGGQKDPSSTIEELLSPDPRLDPMLEKLHAASSASGVPYRICEVNSFSGGGRPGVSDTMAAALWVLDFMWTLAAHGCSGVNIETGLNQLGFVSSYSPITNDAAGHPTVGPEYYGMLAFALGGRGDLVAAILGAPAPGIKAYAARELGKPLTLTLINKGKAAAAVHAQVSGASAANNASVIRLQGPAVNAKTGVTLGGGAVTNRGFWQAGTEEFVAVQGKALTVQLPAASAAVVQIR